MVRVAINGFGRIGRTLFRAGYDDPEIEFVALNDLTDNETLAHLLKYDTVHGHFQGEVDQTEDSIIVDGREIQVLNEKDPSNLPWDNLDIDVAVESTGIFTDAEGTSKHIESGAKKALLSAPGDNMKTIVMGVNEDIYNPEEDDFVSNASCTTNCLAPMAKVLNDKFGIEKGFMTTAHAYTASQNLVDGPNRKDLRRARAAAENLVPTTTGAAKAVGEVIPELDGKLDGMAIRAPIPDGSITDLTVVLEQGTNVEDVNMVFKEASENYMDGIIRYEDEPVVSSDIVDDPASCIFDAQSTHVNGKLVKVLGWYDNEWGFSNRMVDMIKMMAENLE